MTKTMLAQELLTLRRQIALLRQREADILRTMSESEAPPREIRPGWPIRRATSAESSCLSH